MWQMQCSIFGKKKLRVQVVWFVKYDEFNVKKIIKKFKNFNFNKTIFSNIFKQVRENLICQVVEGSLLLKEKFFNWIFRSAF